MRQFSLLILGKVSDGAQRLQVHRKQREDGPSSYGEFSVTELGMRPILFVGGVFPSPISKS